MQSLSWSARFFSMIRQQDRNHVLARLITSFFMHCLRSLINYVTGDKMGEGARLQMIFEQDVGENTRGAVRDERSAAKTRKKQRFHV